jgi:DNA-directed RNA polymerase subunit beta
MLERKNFSRLAKVMEMPNLLDVQLESFHDFLQMGIAKSKRQNKGLQAVFEETFPIESFDGNYKLEFLEYSLDEPKYEILECLRIGMTYAASLKIKVRLRSKTESKEQDVYLGELPLMTPTGTFIINGDERVIVSQLHRSPGISFEEETHPSGKRLFSARVIPYRGAWVEFELDASDTLYVTLDRRRRVLGTTFLRLFGLASDEEIISAFCGIQKIKEVNKTNLKEYLNCTVIKDVVDAQSKEVVLAAYEKLSAEKIEKVTRHEVGEVWVAKKEVLEITNTLNREKSKNYQEALLEVFRRLRPGDPATVDAAELLINRMFKDNKRYDLGPVGRFMLNRKLKMDVPLNERVINLDTLTAVVKSLIALNQGEGHIDDIDHLGNRRVRTVGELLQNQFRIGLARMERACRERMAIYDLENMMPHNLINSKLVSGVIKDFFGRSQLSQFMDQTNPLAEMTHKRRLSALGPGGLSRERAGFEVRDVHHSHYGRICPIETPEGPNIGLIASLCTYAWVNEFGFIETPYRKVVNGRVTEKIDYLSADSEDTKIIAQANARVDGHGKFLDDVVLCRHGGDFPLVDPNKIEYMDVSPLQLVSIAAGLVPFLEHDDANRALMGSNMQRQAVPLMETETPLVGTGLEHRAAKDSGVVVVAENSGTVTHVESDRVVIDDQVYPLRKFMRSNAKTCINQRPIVIKGQRVKAGEVIADGPATKNGELSLGRNLLVAFMPWRGYNFEDAILLNERLVKEDIFTSVHIEEFEIEARDTRLGNEEITRDIPNVGEEALKDLDERGIVRIGAEVHPGDILVGKVAPKSETELTPEEKLLRAIFGEKAGDVRDSSLVVPPGIEGVVVDAKMLSRREKKAKSKEEVQAEFERMQEVKKYYQAQAKQIEEERITKITKLIAGQKVAQDITETKTGKVILAAGKTIGERVLKKLKPKHFSKVKILDNPELDEEIKRVNKIFDDQIANIILEEERESEKVKRGDELPPGVLKKVVVHIATKRKVQVGDKVAGRHGNKGVVARILPQEDMPFLPDGTSIDVVLNPLGVPSRMNVGQILETHLGWAAHELGVYVATPVFDGALELQIKEEMKKANLPEDGKIGLRDGWTGDAFAQRVTVGYIYMMKLVHLVDDKIHARSIGPYSLVTQQPLGGKAQFGGQRFGEMEVWALEAYGAAYTLQELLTVKSDDVEGRKWIYEAIVKGENALHTGTPESFNVLVKELQSLCLDVKLERKAKAEAHEVAHTEAKSEAKEKKEEPPKAKKEETKKSAKKKK